MSLAVSSSQTVVPPCRIQVQRLVSSRYSGQSHIDRPQDWEARRAGPDEVEIVGGAIVRLSSSPMQSPPKPGWILMITGGDADSGFAWTLYGLAPRH
jgi:hypothetical protein